MALLDLVRAGSFKGANFLVVSASTVGGRKQVKHEFPNSDRQSIEDLGFMPKTFSLVVEITVDFDANGAVDVSYFDNKNKLIAALDEGGVGTLSHPFFTVDLEVVAMPYVIEERFDTLGIATFTLTFDSSDRQVNPQPAIDALSVINNQTNAVSNQVNTDIVGGFDTSNGFNLQQSLEVMGTFFSSVRTNTESLTQTTDNINEFSADLNAFQDDIVAIVQVPQALADSVINVIQSTRGLYASAGAALDVFTRFFDFGDNLALVLGTTKDTDQQKLNQDLITNGTKAAYLAQAYQASAVRDYPTVDAVDEIKEVLEDAFDDLDASDISNDLRDKLADLRTTSNAFLDDQRLTAKEVLDVFVNQQPIRTLAFAFYGEDNNEVTTSLAALNDEPNISFIKGDIKILSA